MTTCDDVASSSSRHLAVVEEAIVDGPISSFLFGCLARILFLPVARLRWLPNRLCSARYGSRALGVVRARVIGSMRTMMMCLMCSMTMRTKTRTMIEIDDGGSMTFCYFSLRGFENGLVFYFTQTIYFMFDYYKIKSFIYNLFIEFFKFYVIKI